MSRSIPEIVDSLAATQDLSREDLQVLLTTGDKEGLACLRRRARQAADEVYGKDVFTRGLIEFTNHCKNDCLYCGIRRSNSHADRYRLAQEEILDCCREGWALGFRTFVLQGGEDLYYTDERICGIVSAIRQAYPECAITLSIGEKSRESYEQYFAAGANRYLLRHETADKLHYEKLHPEEMSWDNRMRCLQDLKDIGYQVGCGFMVGSPYQTVDTLYADLQFIRAFQPHMVGIGPFIPQHDTPFGQEQAGTLEQTLRLLSVIRLLHPHVLLPATTALGTIHPQGREMGVQAGANVIMPNLSPVNVRKKYELYDNKICTGDEAAQCRHCLTGRMDRIGYRIVEDRGDYRG